MRGQISLFIILGLALIIVVAFSLLFFSSDRVPEQTGGVATQQVVSHLEGCLANAATDALYMVGRQGGVIETSPYMMNEHRPWLGEGFTDGPQEVIYWYHLEACAQNERGCLSFSPPPLCRDGECVYDSSYAGARTTIQDEVEQYLDEHAATCVEEHSFDNFDLTRVDDPESHVIFTAEDTLVRTHMPVQVSNLETGEEARIEDFSMNLDINMAEVYSLARDILETQYQTQFIEQNLLHYLSLYQGSPPLLPPFTDSEFLGSSEVWSRTQAQESLENEILPYLNFLQIVNAERGYSPIVNTGNFSEAHQEYIRGLYAYSEIVLGVDEQEEPIRYPELGASFFYPYSPIYLNINDEEVLRGNPIRPSNIIFQLASFLFTQYEFNYDIAWPMLATVQAPEAFGGEGYEFTFGLEANIINNVPMSSNRVFVNVDSQDAGELTVRPEDQLEPKEISVHVTDEVSGNPIPEAALEYKCGFSTTVGITDENGLWEGRLPYCAFGGVLEANTGFDYYPDAITYDNVGDGSEHLELSLWPYVERTIEVKRRPIAEDGQSCTAPVGLLETVQESYNLTVDDDGYAVSGDDCEEINCSESSQTREYNHYAMVFLEREQEGLVSEFAPLVPAFTFSASELSLNPGVDPGIIDELVESGELSSSQAQELRAAQDTVDTNEQVQIPRLEEQQVSLIPGTYDISGLLMFDGEVHIPRARVGPFYSRTTIPARNFTSWQLGGVDFSIEFTPEDVYESERIVVHLPEQPLPRSWGDVEDTLTPEELQEEYPGCYGVFFE